MTEKRRSVTFTALIFFGMAVAAAGVVMLFMGVTGLMTELEITNVGTIKTASSGALVLCVGTVFSAVIALSLPDDITVFGPMAKTRGQVLKRLGLPLLVIAVLALVAYLVLPK